VTSMHTVDRVIVTDAAEGRILALARHKRRRIGKKYNRALVVLRPALRDAAKFWQTMWCLHANGLRFTPRGERRIVRAMCKAGHQVRSAAPRRR
jgi:hypothetical protein